LEKEKTKIFIKQVLKQAEDTLTEFVEESDTGNKKSELVAYWLRDYFKYLKIENGYKYNKLKTYERGDIVKANFGFNIGNEEGGLHYALVVDNNNSKLSGVITVIPLSSIKKEDEECKYNVDLGNELYRLTKIKLDSLKESLNNHLKICKKNLNDTKREIDDIREMIKSLSKLDGDTKSLEVELEEKIKRMELKTEEDHKLVEEGERKHFYIGKVEKEFSKMKSGTKALVGQITTISKLRIYTPKYDTDILAGIKISPEKLDLISEKIKDLYIYDVDKSEINAYTKLVEENNAV
jgi:hypothetical protein